MNRKGQVTIFIILAVIIVAAIIIFFLLVRPNGENPQEINPRSAVQKCVRDSVEKSLTEVSEKAGIMDPKTKIQYDSENYTYLCYQADDYDQCYNLFPMLSERVATEIKEKTKFEIQDCFNSMKEDFESRGFSVSGGSTYYFIEILPGVINIKLNKKIQVSKDESSQKFEEFGTNIISPLYDLIKIAERIVDSESEDCNFEYNGHMLLYPNYKITRNDYGGSKLYEITDRQSGMKFKFAVRSCALGSWI